MHITGLYAALCTLLIVVLGVLVTLRRRDARVTLGDGGDAVLLRRVRAHGNAVETVPLALILLLALELDQTQPSVLHVFGIVLVVARLLHGIGVLHHVGRGPGFGRGVGMSLTWLLLLVMAGLLLWRFALRAMA